MAANDGAVKTLDADAIFRSFAACPDDPKTLIVDVRPRNRWEKGHIAGSYCIRKPSSGETLLGEIPVRCRPPPAGPSAAALPPPLLPTACFGPLTRLYRLLESGLRSALECRRVVES
jgi:rhodanese-related sulfurtransferase